MGKKKEFGEGILYTVTNYIYWLLLTNCYFWMANVLLLLAVLTLKPTVSNLALYFLALIPTGPAFSALCYAMEKLVREKSLSPTADFFRGYRVNLKDTMRMWLPMLAILFILVVDIHYYNSEPSTANQMLGAVLSVILLLFVVGSLYAFPINAKFKFRVRDVYRLSVYYSFKKRRATIGNAAIIFITLFVMSVTVDLIILFLASPVGFLLMWNSQEVMHDVKLNFIKRHEMEGHTT